MYAPSKRHVWGLNSRGPRNSLWTHSEIITACMTLCCLSLACCWLSKGARRNDSSVMVGKWSVESGQKPRAGLSPVRPHICFSIITNWMIINWRKSTSYTGDEIACFGASSFPLSQVFTLWMRGLDFKVWEINMTSLTPHYIVMTCTVLKLQPEWSQWAGCWWWKQILNRSRTSDEAEMWSRFTIALGQPQTLLWR